MHLLTIYPSKFKILKEEIRRLERNQERLDVGNAEYLKNVVLKYVEFVDEQEQLIPVLAMLLKFSPGLACLTRHSAFTMLTIALIHTEEMARVKASHAARPKSQSTTVSALEGFASYLQRWT